MVGELINIEEEGKQAGPTNPEYEDLRFDCYYLSFKKEEEIKIKKKKRQGCGKLAKIKSSKRNIKYKIKILFWPSSIRYR